MSKAHEKDETMEDDYDEDADSDFQVADNKDEFLSSSSNEEDEEDDESRNARPKKRRKLSKKTPNEENIGELDSGDEATIRELEKSKKRNKKKGYDSADADSGTEEQGWRARTRAMREREKDDKKMNRLVSIKGSTIDVDKLWEEMNGPGGPDLPPLDLINESTGSKSDTNHLEALQVSHNSHIVNSPLSLQENGMPNEGEEVAKEAENEMITIKRTYRFAGEVHTEEKAVLKSSAEARLWLSQQGSEAQVSVAPDSKPVRRPLRKISRFDPNLNNLDSIKKSWEKELREASGIKGPKLNTVEKSKMDWAAHVDQEGLKEELDEHAKAKEGYLGRMDFLGEVEQRREEEARMARLKG